MTIREAIAFVDETFPNTFSNETKTRWLSQCDAEIWQDVMLLPSIAFPGYRWGTDADRPLIAPEAYEMMYVYWLDAQMHKAYQEIAEYTNAAQLYNHLRTRFTIWYADTFDPAHGGIMPLPPITTFRRGETATLVLAWVFPYPLEDINYMQITISNGDTMHELLGENWTLYSGYMSYTFTQAESLSLTPGIYRFHAVGTTHNGTRFETQVAPWSISVLDTTTNEVID